MQVKYFIYLSLFVFIFISCENDNPPYTQTGIDLTHIAYNPDSLTIVVPDSFPIFEQPADNVLTADGVELGRHLFYDPLLSRDESMSCSSCHLPASGFTDNLSVSPGVDGIAGNRSSMALLNVGFFYTGLFWDGKVQTLEEQALLPVEDPIELHTTWPEVIDKLKEIPEYQERYRKAFGITNSSQIDKFLTAKALAQFERSLVSSGQSKFDLIKSGQEVFTDKETIGRDIFFDLDPFGLPDGQCFHCHAGPLFTDGTYLNNGLTEAETHDDFPDNGLGDVTGLFSDNGKFRVPTLRNIALTAPYMHDGRFNTLEEVMEHYNSGGHPSIGKSSLMDSINLNAFQQEAVIEFLHTLTDTTFVNDPRYSDPN